MGESQPQRERNLDVQPEQIVLMILYGMVSPALYRPDGEPRVIASVRFQTALGQPDNDTIYASLRRSPRNASQRTYEAARGQQWRLAAPSPDSRPGRWIPIGQQGVGGPVFPGVGYARCCSRAWCCLHGAAQRARRRACAAGGNHGRVGRYCAARGADLLTGASRRLWRWRCVRTYADRARHALLSTAWHRNDVGTLSAHAALHAASPGLDAVFFRQCGVRRAVSLPRCVCVG